MTTIKNLMHDLAAMWRAALNEWKRCQFMRRGGNPDFCEF